MVRIPAAPLVLGLAGLLPFVWGAASAQSPALQGFAATWLGPRFAGPYVLLSYGTVVLCFMSGVLWGFATRPRAASAPAGYVLSAIPALWAFFMVSGGPASAGLHLIIGFAGLLAIDLIFFNWGLAPRWWMHLRVLLTAIVIACLAIGVFV